MEVLEQANHAHCQCFTLCLGVTLPPVLGERGRESFWQTWQAFEEVTETLAYLASDSFKSLDADC